MMNKVIYVTSLNTASKKVGAVKYDGTTNIEVLNQKGGFSKLKGNLSSYKGVDAKKHTGTLSDIAKMVLMCLRNFGQTAGIQSTVKIMVPGVSKYHFNHLVKVAYKGEEESELLKEESPYALSSSTDEVKAVKELFGEVVKEIKNIVAAGRNVIFNDDKDVAYIRVSMAKMPKYMVPFLNGKNVAIDANRKGIVKWLNKEGQAKSWTVFTDPIPAGTYTLKCRNVGTQKTPNFILTIEDTNEEKVIKTATQMILTTLINDLRPEEQQELFRKIA